MLVLSQVLKVDVPDYKEMPKTAVEKLSFLKTKLKNLIAPNFQLHREVIYPALIEWSFSDAVLMDEIRADEEAILSAINELKIADAASLDAIGIGIEQLVRKKERVLYQKMQNEFEHRLEELAIA